MVEEIIEEPGTPAQPSEPIKPEGEKPETPDLKTELSGLEKRIGDKIEKKMSEVWFSLRKVSKGEPLEEETAQLTQDQIRGIVAEVVKEETGKIGEQLNQQVTELTKSFASSFSKSKGGGEGGQRLPKEDSTPRPQLNDDEEEAVKGLDWDGKREGWIDPQTKQFFPLKREVVTKE